MYRVVHGAGMGNINKGLDLQRASSQDDVDLKLMMTI